MNAAEYSAFEQLRDGREIEVRALKPADRAGWLEYIERTSDAARYRRFFVPKRTFSEQEIEFHLNVDFVRHVALVAVIEEAGHVIGVGGARYVVSQPGRATMAFQVDDPHQGLGIATCLMRHLVAIARDAGITELVAEVLPDNAPMLKVLERSGLPMTTRREIDTVHVTPALWCPPPTAAGTSR